MTVQQQQSKLSRLYEHLVKQARRANGSPRRCPLPGGANMCATINGENHLLTFSRQDKPLGDVELNTFHAHCEIPAHARRIPEQGQTQRTKRVTHDGAEFLQIWYVVGFEWTGEV